MEWWGEGIPRHSLGIQMGGEHEDVADTQHNVGFQMVDPDHIFPSLDKV
jgi:hypothetical protein